MDFGFSLAVQPPSLGVFLSPGGRHVTEEKVEALDLVQSISDTAACTRGRDMGCVSGADDMYRLFFFTKEMVCLRVRLCKLGCV